MSLATLAGEESRRWWCLLGCVGSSAHLIATQKWTSSCPKACAQNSLAVRALQVLFHLHPHCFKDPRQASTELLQVYLWAGSGPIHSLNCISGSHWYAATELGRPCHHSLNGSISPAFNLETRAQQSLCLGIGVWAGVGSSALLVVSLLPFWLQLLVLMTHRRLLGRLCYYSRVF